MRRQRHHRLADAAPQGPGPRGADDSRPRRQRRRRQRPGPARAACRHPRHRHRLAAPPRRAARDREPNPSTTTTRASRIGSVTSRPAASTPSSTTSAVASFARSFAPARAGRDAGRVRHCGAAEDANNNVILTFVGLLRPARALEPAAQPPAGAVLQLLGRQAGAPGAVSRAPGFRPAPRSSRCWRTVPSRRTSPPGSRWHDASRAMALAESRTVYGKVVLVP